MLLRNSAFLVNMLSMMFIINKLIQLIEQKITKGIMQLTWLCTWFGVYSQIFAILRQLVLPQYSCTRVPCKLRKFWNHYVFGSSVCLRRCITKPQILQYCCIRCWIILFYPKSIWQKKKNLSYIWCAPSVENSKELFWKFMLEQEHKKFACMF